MQCTTLKHLKVSGRLNNLSSWYEGMPCLVTCGKSIQHFPYAISHRTERETHLLFAPRRWFQQDEEKSGYAISDGCKRAESRSSTIDLPAQTQKSLDSGSSSDMVAGTDEDEADTTITPQIDHQQIQAWTSNLPNSMPRPRRRRRRRRLQQDGKNNRDKKYGNRLQQSLKSLLNQRLKKIKIDSNTPIRVMLAEMEDNQMTFNPHAYQYCVRWHKLDEEDIRGKERRQWIRVMDCIISAIKCFGIKERLLVDGVVCLSVLSSINEVFREIIVEDENILDYVHDLAIELLGEAIYDGLQKSGGNSRKERLRLRGGPRIY